MKFFESRYTLALTLGLICTQMYLTKSSVVDYKNIQLRGVAQAKETIQCTISTDISDVTKFNESEKNCFLNFNFETQVLTAVMRRKSDDKITYSSAKKAYTNKELQDLLKLDSEPTKKDIQDFRNKEIGIIAGRAISTFNDNDSFSVIHTEDIIVEKPKEKEKNSEEIVEENTEIKKDKDEDTVKNKEKEKKDKTETQTETETEVAQETIDGDNEEITRLELRKILKSYKTLADSVSKTKDSCTFDSEEVDFDEVIESYESLNAEFIDNDDDEDKDQKEIKCDDKDCSNLSQEDIAQAYKLKELVEDFPSKKNYTISSLKEINECKDARLNDEDFLKAYRSKGACSEGDGSIKIGSQRRSLVTRFRRNNETGPQKAVNETLARAQVCYYTNEILPSLRKGYATGDEDQFINTLNRANELAGSIDSNSELNNEAIRTSLELEPEIGMRLRLYEDVLHDRITAINASNLTAEQKATHINNLKKNAAAGFKADQARISQALTNGNAMQAEVDLLMGNNGLYSFWGNELADINNERQPQLGAQSSNHIAAIAFSGLDQSTQDAINGIHDKTQNSVLDSNERALANAGVTKSTSDPIRDQLNANREIVPRTLRVSRAKRRLKLADSSQNGRLYRATNAPDGGLRPRIDQALNNSSDQKSIDPAVSYLVDDSKQKGRRNRSRGRLSRDTVNNQTSSSLR